MTTLYRQACQGLSEACARVVRDVGAGAGDEWGVGVLEDLSSAVMAVAELGSVAPAALRNAVARAALLRRQLDTEGTLNADDLAEARELAERCAQLAAAAVEGR